MIASLTGKSTYRSDKYCILDVSGVGYKVFAVPSVLDATQGGQEVFLFIHTVVREDALELYGFTDQSSLGLFEQLITVSGIGPRAAISVLSVSTIETLIGAISENNITYLTQISGIGKKTAEKILLELKDRVVPLETSSGNSVTSDSELLLALLSLGYTQAESREALSYVTDINMSIEDKIKLVLKNMSTHGKIK